MNPIENNKKLYKEFEEAIRENKWEWYGWLHHFKCIRCEKYCSSGTFMFFNKNPEKVLCRECQKN